MEEIIKNAEVAMEIEEYEDSQKEMSSEEVDPRITQLTRQRNSRRKAAAKNADFEAKKASKKEAKIEKNSDSYGHCPMKSKQILFFKTARRRAMRRKANKLVASEE